jgi:hypothetical protein
MGWNGIFSWEYHGWLPLKNMKVSWEYYSQYVEKLKYKKKVPNHRPECIYNRSIE